MSLLTSLQEYLMLIWLIYSMYTRSYNKAWFTNLKTPEIFRGIPKVIQVRYYIFWITTADRPCIYIYYVIQIDCTVHQLGGESIISLSLQAYHVPSMTSKSIPPHSWPISSPWLIRHWNQGGKACIKSIATRGVSKSRISLSNINIY